MAKRTIRKPIARRSPKRIEQDKELAKKKRVFLKLNPWCAGCLARFRRRGNKSRDVHHMRGHAGSLYLDQRFWLAMCRKCHNWVRDNIPQARDLGLVCKLGEWGKQEP